MPIQDEFQSKGRPIIVTVVLIAIVTIVFGFWGIKKSINLPFSEQGEGAYKTLEEQEEIALASLKETDTDNDGLSDYDERFIYRTNSYLEDTDSDGISDMEEITGNSDPNCPKGSICQVARVSSDNSSNGSEIVDPPAVDVDQQTLAFIDAFGDPRELTRAEAEATLRGMSPTILREFFIRMGVPQEAVDGANDSDLRELALEAFKEITFVNDLTSGSEGESEE